MNTVYPNWEEIPGRVKSHWVKKNHLNETVAIISSDYFVDILDTREELKNRWYNNQWLIFSSFEEAAEWADAKMLEFGYRIIDSSLQVMG